MTLNMTTETDVTFLANEETTRAFIHLVTPLIQNAVSAAIPVGFTGALNELQMAREELKAAAEKYVTAEDVRRIGQNIGQAIEQPLSNRIDTHLKELSAEDLKRDQAFAVRIGEVNALGLKNEQRLSMMEAVYQERLGKLENRLTKIEHDITTGVAAVARNSAIMNRTIAQWLEENKKREEMTALEIKSLHNARIQFEREIRDNQDDTSNLRGDVEGLRGDIGATVRPMQETVRELKPRIATLEAQFAAAALTLDKINQVAAAALWLFKSRKGNGILAFIACSLGGMQLLFAFLAYQFIVRMPQ